MTSPSSTPEKDLIKLNPLKNYNLRVFSELKFFVGHVKFLAWLAQSVEHETFNLRVVGSSPTLDDIILLAFDKQDRQHALIVGANPNLLTFVLTCGSMICFTECDTYLD